MNFHFDRQRANELLKKGTGHENTEFRDGQEEAIEGLVSAPRRMLIVQRTGWGKSMVYFVATKLLREKAMGVALLVSPLLALMRNQMEAANRMGLNAQTIHSGNKDQWDEVKEAVKNQEVDILLISPERLANEEFKAEVLSEISDAVSLLIVDEAHCISDWGHDFRPHYRLITRLIQQLPQNTRLLATTATANDRVTSDLQEILGPELMVIRGPLNRQGLTLETIRMDNAAHRLAWLDAALHRLEGNGIIYVLTQRDAINVSVWLTLRGHHVAAYTSDSGDVRPELEQALLKNRYKALVATVALGMGFDKPDLSFVLHYQMPGSVIAYYQQVGRAGRGIDQARGILLSGVEDEEIHDHFIGGAFPTRTEVEKVFEVLSEAEDGLTRYQILRRVNVRAGRLEKVLQLLSLESPAPIVKEKHRYFLTATEFSDEFWERSDRLTQLRWNEFEEMKQYMALPFGEHMEFLMNKLDSKGSSKDALDVQAPLSIELDGISILAAEKHLRRTWKTFEPRKQWPHSVHFEQFDDSGKITMEKRAELGRALCYYGDTFWGKLVRVGKYEDGRFSDELVEAMKEMLRETFEDEFPKWLTCVPSGRHPELVPDFAGRLAEALEIPFHPIIEAAREKPVQKIMQNSAYQVRNLDGAFEVKSEVPEGPVFLFDDMVDSGWTMTVLSYALIENGCSAVHPISLALAQGA